MQKDQHLMHDKEFDVTEVKSNAFAFIQDFNNEIYKVFAKTSGKYVFTLTLDRNTNKTELQIEEIDSGDTPIPSSTNNPHGLII